MDHQFKISTQNLQLNYGGKIQQEVDIQSLKEKNDMIAIDHDISLIEPETTPEIILPLVIMNQSVNMN